MPEIFCAQIRKQADQFTAFPVIYSTCRTPLTETVLSVPEFLLLAFIKHGIENYAYILSSNGYMKSFFPWRTQTRAGHLLRLLVWWLRCITNVWHFHQQCLNDLTVHLVWDSPAIIGQAFSRYRIQQCFSSSHCRLTSVTVAMQEVERSSCPWGYFNCLSYTDDVGILMILSSVALS